MLDMRVSDYMQIVSKKLLSRDGGVMKMKKSKKMKGILTFVMIAFVLILGSHSQEVQAASKATKAKKAYNSFLSNIYEKKDFQEFSGFGSQYGAIFFVVKDISGDSVPELIIRETYTSPYSFYVYTYKSGKVKKLKEMSYYSGGEILKIYPKKHVVKASVGDDWSSENIYYYVSGSKMKVIAKEDNGSYYVKGKRVSASKYNSYVRKIEKSKGYSLDSGQFKLRKNTSSNRTKYLK